ncbi:MAG: ribonuclease HII [Chloroflexi bacterium]|nr:ribonuclease HII [Chloroflexota bacterium]
MGQQPDLVDEHRLWRRGCMCIAGIDEAGRGAWAGPVVAAAVVLPRLPDLRRLLAPVRDSKQLLPSQREYCYELILSRALDHGVGVVSPAEIDELGIVAATREAMIQAVRTLRVPPDGLIIDALSLPRLALPQVAVPKADLYSLSVAAASIVAKVTRDRLMVALDAQLPEYGFAAHKGYGTEQHRRALLCHGPSEYHRRSFAPVRALLEVDDV